MKISFEAMALVFFTRTVHGGHLTRVVFDPTHADVPKHLKNQKDVVFDYALGLPVPITDWSVDHLGIRATLSFGGSLETTFVPWTTVLAVVDLAEDTGIIRGEVEAPPPKPGLRLVKDN